MIGFLLLLDWFFWTLVEDFSFGFGDDYGGAGVAEDVDGGAGHV